MLVFWTLKGFYRYYRVEEFHEFEVTYGVQVPESQQGHLARMRKWSQVLGSHCSF